MRTMKSLWLLLVLALVVSGGCKEKNPYGTTVVTGTVTVDGSPMAGVNVSFSPIGEGGNSAVGQTNEKGQYTLTTGGAPVGSGAIPGEYDVALSKTELESVGMSMEEYQQKIGDRQPNTVYIIPEKYGNAKNSGLGPKTVEAGKKNVIDFEISTKD